MILRYIEICPHCKCVMPWRKRAIKVARGQRRVYVECRRCKAHDVIVYIDKNTKSSPMGNQNSNP